MGKLFQLGQLTAEEQSMVGRWKGGNGEAGEPWDNASWGLSCTQEGQQSLQHGETGAEREGSSPRPIHPGLRITVGCRDGHSQQIQPGLRDGHSQQIHPSRAQGHCGMQGWAVLQCPPWNALSHHGCELCVPQDVKHSAMGAAGASTGELGCITWDLCRIPTSDSSKSSTAAACSNRAFAEMPIMVWECWVLSYEESWATTEVWNNPLEICLKEDHKNICVPLKAGACCTWGRFEHCRTKEIYFFLKVCLCIEVPILLWQYKHLPSFPYPA